MRQNSLILIVPVLLAASSAILAVWPPTPFRETPQINAEHRENGSVANQSQATQKLQALENHEGLSRQEGSPEFYGVKPGEFLLFIATMGLWYATQRLVTDTREAGVKQLEISRKTIVMTQRPKLRVRNVVATDPDLPTGHYATGQFYVSNVGGTPAHIIESHCIVYWSSTGLPMKRPYEGENGNMPIGKITISSGESFPALFQSDTPTERRADPSKKIVGGASVYVMGWIEYQDDLNIRRRTAFCREFKQPSGQAFHSARFYPVDDLDYEHEE